MLIDIRGLNHPQHLQEFKRHLEGFCTIHDDVEVLLDNNKDNLKKLEIYIRSLRAEYTIDYDDDFVRIKILAPFSLCG